MTRAKTIDLNLDAGESEADLLSGREDTLYQFVSSVNIACGGHAGSKATMEQAVDLADRRGLAIGAHPSFPDRDGFGRNVIQIPDSELSRSLEDQLQALRTICLTRGLRVRHVKPHGALYNVACDDPHLADLLIETVIKVDANMRLFGLAGSILISRARRRGLATAEEGFVDRRYEPNGRLRSRACADALITDANKAAEQAVRLAEGRAITAVDGSPLNLTVDTLCIHGDAKESLAVAQNVHSRLRAAGFKMAPLDPS